MSNKKAAWISYDFGLKGDYAGLYTWLDENGAVECGHGLAFFEKETDDPAKFVDDITISLKQKVKLSPSDRLYIIWKNNNKMEGDFINGTRRLPPWNGYSNNNGNLISDIGE